MTTKTGSILRFLEEDIPAFIVGYGSFVLAYLAVNSHYLLLGILLATAGILCVRYLHYVPEETQ